MTNEQTSVLVLKDQAGEYYLLPQETLEQGRVPAEHKAEVERLIAADDAGGDDVQGHLLPLFFAAVVLTGAALGYSGAKLGIGIAEATETGTLNRLNLPSRG